MSNKKVMRTRNYSIKRHIIGVTGVSYALILILLLVLDYYSISNYRSQLQQSNTKYFETEMNLLKNKIADLDDFIMDIYLNNTNMKILQSETDYISLYNASYDLNSQCNSKLRMDSSMLGYYFSYRGGSRYQFAENKNISTEAQVEQREKIASTVKTYLENSKNGINWFLIEIEGDTLYIICCKKNRFSIAGIAILENTSLSEREAKQQNKVNLLDKGGLYFNSEAVIEGLQMEQKEFDDFRFAELDSGVWKTRAMGDDHYSVYMDNCGKEDLYLYSIIKSDIIGLIGWVQLLLLAITAISVVGAFFVYHYMKKLFMEPLYEFTNTMNEIRGGNWDAKIEKGSRYEEIKEVGDTLNALISEIERLKIESYEEMLDKQRTLVQYLQLQLKPHFYLNCMKMLNALTMQKEYERLQELIINISAHLRYLLYHKEVLVSLGDEITYVKNYLQLQKSLFLRPGTCEFHVEEEAHDWLIPILCIQTFVENSLKYCVLPAGIEELKLSINVILLHTEEEDFIDITISDNGVGYPEEVLALLNNQDIIENERLGVGITNLKKRFAIFYDKPVEYLFQNQDGAVSEMIIPRKDVIDNEFVNRR